MKLAFVGAICAMGLVACTPQTQSSNGNPVPSPTTAVATTEVVSPPSDVTPSAEVLPEITSKSEVDNQCLTFSEHAYEVCTAYLFNASLDARLPFYKLGRSTGVGYYKAILEGCTGRSAGPAATCRLKSRYYGQAQSYLLAQTAGWPDEVDVSLPRISIEGVDSDLAANTAVLSTTETWQVRTKSGDILFAESGQHHTITMKRIQGLILHKWVVTSIQ
ncbi:MAG: hypothetical protein JWQ20_4657 [Conexibacter sp.]|nr:hypothetical protein [Conexibacter sp.]